MICENLKELIDALKQFDDKVDKELDIIGEVEVGLNDEWKTMPVKFSCVDVVSDHPKKVKLYLK